MPNTSYLDFVKPSFDVGDLHQSTFVERNAYLNNQAQMSTGNFFDPHPNQKAVARRHKHTKLAKPMSSTVHISNEKRLKKSTSEIFEGMRCSAEKKKNRKRDLLDKSHLTTEPYNTSSQEREAILPSLLEKIKMAQHSIE